MGAIRRSAKSVLVGVLSLAICVGAVMFVFTQPSATLATTLHGTRVTTMSTLLYGKIVNSAGRPLKGVRVAVHRVSGGVHRVDRVMYTASTGTYRSSWVPLSGAYHVEMSVRAGGHMARRSIGLSMLGDLAYKLNAKLLRGPRWYFYKVWPYRIYSSTTVLYGKVTTNAGAPLRGVRIAVHRVLRGRHHVDRYLYTASNGTYRGAWRPLSGAYHVEVSVRSGGRTVKKTVSLAMRRDRAYRLNAKLMTQTYWLFLPIMTY